MTEPIFWRNYFYRVTIVKQTILSSPPSEIKETNQDVLFDFKDEVSDHEEEDKVTSSSKDSIVVVEKKKEESSSMPSDEKYEGMEEWEIELLKRVNK